MGKNDDVEKGEKQSLLHHKGKGLDEDDKRQIKMMQELGAGSDGMAKFKDNCQFTLRVAFFACVLGSVVWVPMIRGLFPPAIGSKMGMAALLFIFCVKRIWGQTIQSGIGMLWSTWLACLHMWVLQGIFPGGVKHDTPMYVMIFGWANFMGFLWLVYWSKCNLGTKMCAVAYDIGFMTDFLNPDSTAVYSTHFKIKSSGIAVNCMLATAIAVFLAICCNILPYPSTTAFKSMRDSGLKVAADMSQLVEVLVDYYSGDGPSIVIESAKKHAGDVKGKLDGLGDAIGAAYYESLDMGVSGTIRKHNEAHAALLGTVFDRVKAIMVALLTEDFAESHKTIMKAITPACKSVSIKTQTLLMEVTNAISDGDLSSSEKDSLRKCVQKAKDAVAELAKEFDTVRRTFDATVHPELLGESFFVLELSAYSRLVCEYTEECLDKPPPAGNGVFADLSNWFASTWKWADLTEKYNMNFATRYWAAVMFAWCYCIFIAGRNMTTCVICTFLLSTRVAPDIQGSLDGMLGVTASILAGAITYQLSCSHPDYGNYILPAAAFCFWLVTLYSSYSGSKFAGIGLLAAAIGATKFVALCPEGSVGGGELGLWNVMMYIMYATTIICAFEFIFSIDRASNLSLQALDDAFKGVQAAFTAFWTQKDIGTAIAPVSGLCDQANAFNNSARIEPRFWRYDWKDSLHADLVESIRTIRLDLLMMESAMEGSGGSASGLFDKFADTPEWKSIRKDLDSTMEQARFLAVTLVGLEKGKFSALEKELDFESDNKMDELEDLPDLLKTLAGVMEFPEKAPATMEEDDLCKVSVVLVMLQSTCLHIAHIVKVVINNA